MYVLFRHKQNNRGLLHAAATRNTTAKNDKMKKSITLKHESRYDFFTNICVEAGSSAREVWANRYKTIEASAATTAKSGRRTQQKG